MHFPNKIDKYKDQPIMMPQQVIEFRRQSGVMPAIQPPEDVIICMRTGLPQRRKMRSRHPYQKAGRLMGDLLLLKKTGGRVAVITNLGIGAPMIASLAEELIAWGVMRLVAISWAGGLQLASNVGDIIVCDRAIRDEGTSYHYLPPDKHIQSSPELTALLAASFDNKNFTVSMGTTWTTDAPYRETVKEIQQYQAEGVMTVEMETSALYTIGRVRGIQTASVLVIGDSLAKLRWEAPQDVKAVERSLEHVYSSSITALANS